MGNKTYQVVAAVITKEDKIFCAQRGPTKSLPLKWEFPGGKVEENEDHKQALKREIQEELKSEILVKDFIITSYYEYKDFNIYLHAYYCELINGNLELSEHINSKWVNLNEIDDLDWANADLPIVERIKETRNDKIIFN